MKKKKSRKRLCGYVEMRKGRRVLADVRGHVVAHLSRGNCTKIRPGQRGGWISTTQCSYYATHDGHRYYGRGYGKGMSLCLRALRSRA